MNETSQTTPKSLFTTAKKQALEEAKASKVAANRLSLLRLVAFFALVAVVILASIEVHPVLGIFLVAAGLFGFNRLVGKQNELDEKHNRQLRIAEINDGEILSLNYEFDQFEPGSRFADAAHPYSGDLDIFGPNSIFQLFNRTASLVGSEALAAFMRSPLQQQEQIEERQQAVQELRDQLAWRQLFSAYGINAPVKADAIVRLRTWASAPITLTESYWKWLIPLLSIFNILWLVSFVYFPFYLCLVAYIPSLYLLYKAKPRVDHIHQETELAVELLGRYKNMISAVEQQSWSSKLLVSLADNFKDEGHRASRILAQLSYASRQLAVRSNPYVLLLNLFSFWEVRYARKLEHLKGHSLSAKVEQGFPMAAQFELPGEQPTLGEERLLDQWLKTLGAFDALSSFAAAAFRWPTWAFPQVLAEAQTIEGSSLHHPLLPPDRSVSNDFVSASESHIVLLTGSNMAGKSTFLRTVGLHITMAHWGTATPSKGLKTPLLRVYTSMRTQDNLHEGASAFYAELQRLRFVVEATSRGENVFFLLDEILKGTNSQDRHEGGRALIKQLISHGGAGIIATHDLELGELANERPDINNIRLEVETNAEGELFFDYQVKPGLAQSRNASALMRQMGLGST